MAIRYSALLFTVIAALSACSKKEAPARPDPSVNITAATVARKDLPITEIAVGAETALDVALGYDPTRVSRTAYVRLPFPEHVAARLKVGQAVTISNFNQPERTVQGTIREIRPALIATTLSNDVIVTIPASQNWRPEGSVRGAVTLGITRNALVVPEQAVVMRPAGPVVYLINGNTVTERPISSGIVRNGMIQITQGLNVGDPVAVDGAAMLTSGAKINVIEKRS